VGVAGKGVAGKATTGAGASAAGASAAGAGAKTGLLDEVSWSFRSSLSLRPSSLVAFR
jgi:hypothetical protein